ncbi:hypothetical protein G6F31_014856 [Rhizopus arrhizus]|nr:hypothetical protein G6F31_014856 [Rhizopus arrhizus]
MAKVGCGCAPTRCSSSRYPANTARSRASRVSAIESALPATAGSGCPAPGLRYNRTVQSVSSRHVRILLPLAPQGARQRAPVAAAGHHRRDRTAGTGRSDRAGHRTGGRRQQGRAVPSLRQQAGAGRCRHRHAHRGVRSAGTWPDGRQCALRLLHPRLCARQLRPPAAAGTGERYRADPGQHA